MPKEEGHIGLNSEKIEAEDNVMSSRYSNWSISLPPLAAKFTEETGLKLDPP